MKAITTVSYHALAVATVFALSPSSAFAQSAKAKQSAAPVSAPTPVVEEEGCIVQGEQGLCKIKKPDAAATAMWKSPSKALYEMCRLSNASPATRPKFIGRCVNQFVEGIAFVSTPNSNNEPWTQKWVADFTRGMPGEYAAVYSESRISVYNPPHDNEKSTLWLCFRQKVENVPNVDVRLTGVECLTARRALGDKVLSDEVYQAVLAGTFNPTVAALGEQKDDLKVVGGKVVNPQFAREQAAKKQAEEQRQRQEEERQRQADAAAAAERERLAKEKEARDLEGYKKLMEALIKLQSATR